MRMKLVVGSNDFISFMKAFEPNGVFSTYLKEFVELQFLFGLLLQNETNCETYFLAENTIF